jgi:type II secretory pathway pseudopilin PulG
MIGKASSRAQREAGLSLVELMIALVVFAIAMIALFSLIVSSSQVQQETREKALAYNTARLKIEEMRNATFAEVFMRYNAVNDALPAVTGQPVDAGNRGPTNTREPGEWFPIEGLNTVTSLGDSMVGKIDFPVVNNNLAEDITSPTSDPDLETQLGLPKDLNRNATSNETNVSTNYKILPVRVRVRWLGVGKKITTIYVTSLITEK